MLRSHAVRRSTWTRFARRCGAATLTLLVLFPLAAFAHPSSDLEVGDPLEDAVRVLDLYPGLAPGRFHTRPLVRAVLLADSTGADSAAALAYPAAIARRRIDRALWRDRPGPFTPGPVPP